MITIFHFCWTSGGKVAVVEDVRAWGDCPGRLRRLSREKDSLLSRFDGRGRERTRYGDKELRSYRP